LLSAVGGSANPILIARVNEPTTFLDGAVDFLNHVKRALKIAGDVKSEINYQEKDIAGKPSRLFNITVAGGGETTRSSLLLTAQDNKTILGCLVDGGKPEDVISTYSKAAQTSLADSAAIKIARAQLPDKLQVAVFIDLQSFGFLAGARGAEIAKQ